MVRRQAEPTLKRTRHVTFLLVHTGHDAEHPGPTTKKGAQREENEPQNQPCTCHCQRRQAQRSRGDLHDRIMGPLTTWYRSNWGVTRTMEMSHEESCNDHDKLQQLFCSLNHKHLFLHTTGMRTTWENLHDTPTGSSNTLSKKCNWRTTMVI